MALYLTESDYNIKPDYFTTKIYTMKLILTFLILFFSSTLYSQTQSICPGQPVPTGWIIIGSTSCAGCCGTAGQIVNMPTIKRFDNLPSGTTLSICPGQETPAGWVITGSTSCAGCCGLGGQTVNMPTIKKL